MLKINIKQSLFLLSLIFVGSCQINKLNVEYVSKIDKEQKPVFLNKNSIKEIITEKNNSMCFWIEYYGIDSVSLTHMFNVYNEQGTFLRRHHYYLLKFRTLNLKVIKLR